MNKRIYLCLAHMSSKEQTYIKEAFDTNWVVPLGPNVNGFEKDLETFVGEDKRVVALSAGTAAVHLALLACGVKPGDEVLVQSFTFCASSHPITYLGATPVFVDSEVDTWNMDPVLLEEAIKDRIEKTGKTPKAIVPVALYGMPYKVDEIMAVADRYGIPVIEDAAEGFGSRYDGRMLGTFGEYGVLSFNGNKMITTSGGGALICPDEEAKREIMFYATQAREAYQATVQGAVGGAGGVTHAAVNAHTDCEPNANVEAMRVGLDAMGIESRPLWKPMHKQPVYKDCPAYVNGVSESLFKVGLCLPSGPYVTDRDIEYIVGGIRGLIER